MAIVQPRAPRHILYILVALAALAACEEREADDPRPATEERAPTDSDGDSDRSTGQSASPPSAPAHQSASAPSAAGPVAGQPAWPPNPSAGQSASASPTSPTTTDPESGFHLDDPEVEYELPRRQSRQRKGPTIQIVLRSSPPGAVAAVDGVAVGPTPTLWEGTVDATPREFTFVLPGYAIARYRFVPTRSGIVHGTLEAIKAEGEEGDPRHRRPVRAPAPAPPAVK
jgi:hypothetical protein